MDDLNKLNEFEERLAALTSTDDELKSVGTIELRTRNEELTKIYNEVNDFVDDVLKRAVNSDGYSLDNIIEVATRAKDMSKRALDERRLVNIELNGKEKLWRELRDKFRDLGFSVRDTESEISRINNEIEELNDELSASTDDIKRARFEGIINVNKEALSKLEERSNKLLEERNDLINKIRITTNGGTYPEEKITEEDEKELNDEITQSPNPGLESELTPSLESDPELEQSSIPVPAPEPEPAPEPITEEIDSTPISEQSSIPVSTPDPEPVPEPITEETDSTPVPVPESEPELEEESRPEPVRNVVQPKPTLWQKVSNVLKAAGGFLLTAITVHTGITAHYAKELYNKAEYEQSNSDEDKDENKKDESFGSVDNNLIDPSPLPSFPQSNPTPTPTPAPQKDPASGQDQTSDSDKEKDDVIAHLDKGERIVDTNSNIEITNTGDVYSHNGDDTTKLEDKQLPTAPDGTSEVRESDFENNKELPQTPLQSAAPVTGDEKQFADATPEEQQSIEDAVAGLDFDALLGNAMQP